MQNFLKLLKLYKSECPKKILKHCPRPMNCIIKLQVLGTFRNYITVTYLIHYIMYLVKLRALGMMLERIPSEFVNFL